MKEYICFWTVKYYPGFSFTILQATTESPTQQRETLPSHPDMTRRNACELGGYGSLHAPCRLRIATGTHCHNHSRVYSYH